MKTFKQKTGTDTVRALFFKSKSIDNGLIGGFLVIFSREKGCFEQRELSARLPEGLFYNSMGFFTSFRMTGGGNGQKKVKVVKGGSNWAIIAL